MAGAAARSGRRLPADGPRSPASPCTAPAPQPLLPPACSLPAGEPTLPWPGHRGPSHLALVQHAKPPGLGCSVPARRPWAPPHAPEPPRASSQLPFTRLHRHPWVLLCAAVTGPGSPCSRSGFQLYSCAARARGRLSLRCSSHPEHRAFPSTCTSRDAERATRASTGPQVERCWPLLPFTLLFKAKKNHACREGPARETCGDSDGMAQQACSHAAPAGCGKREDWLCSGKSRSQRACVRHCRRRTARLRSSVRGTDRVLVQPGARARAGAGVASKLRPPTWLC